MIRARVYIGVSILAGLVAIYCIDHMLETDVGFLLMVLAFMCAALTEFHNLVAKKGCAPFRRVVLGSAVAYVCMRWLRLRGSIEGSYDVLALTLFMFLVFLAQGLRHKTDDAVKNISGALFGFMYIPFLGGHVLDLRFLESDGTAIGEQAVISLILIAKSVDTGAYFVGRKFGRTQLSPVLSPKKSVEGLVAGLLSGLLVAVLLHRSPGLRIAPLWWTAVVSLAIGAAGQLGDLTESMIKRDVEVKDSNVIPGLGGVLDIIDCLLVAAPVVYYLLRIGPKL